MRNQVMNIFDTLFLFISIAVTVKTAIANEWFAFSCWFGISIVMTINISIMIMRYFEDRCKKEIKEKYEIR